MSTGPGDSAVSGKNGAVSRLGRLVCGDLDAEIIEVAVATIAAHETPVSLPRLCNVLWFDQPVGEGYDGLAFSSVLADLPSFAHGFPNGTEPIAAQRAFPLGAIISVRVGNDIAYGEVVWKEGAHPLLEGPWVPGWLAGAPSGAPTDGQRPPVDFTAPAGDRILRERLVMDFACLGEELAPSPAQLLRLRSRGRRLDRFGHLVADVVYRNGLDEADEVAFWAAWVVAHHPRALTRAGIEPNASALAEAAGVLSSALDERDDLRSFGPYFVTAQAYDDMVHADTTNDLGLARTVRGLARVASGDTEGWASMSQRLAETCDPELLIGTAWPSTVVTASLLALDTLAAEAPDGDWHGTHLRLDDTWQGGGLWRAEVLENTTPIDADPAVALGLGWVAYTGGEIARVPPSGEGLDTVDAPDWYDEDDLEWDLQGSEATWLVHLSATDIDTDRFRLPTRISEAVVESLYTRDQEWVLVVLAHDGESEQRIWTEVENDGHLRVEWPLGILPGTSVRASWQVASTVINVSTTLLATPEDVAGTSYRHVYNLALALAAAGLGESGSPTVTVRQLVRAAVRRHGDATEHGDLILGIDAIVDYCFGPEGEVAPGYDRAMLHRSVVAAARGLVATGEGRIDGEFVVVSPALTEAGRRADAGLLNRFVDATSQRLRRRARKHYVPPSIVNLPPTWRRSPAKGAEWDEVAGTEGLPDTDLAPNQTWRRGHVRGAGIPAEITAELERAKRSLERLGGDAAPELDAAVGDPYAEGAPERTTPPDPLVDSTSTPDPRNPGAT